MHSLAAFRRIGFGVASTVGLSGAGRPMGAYLSRVAYSQGSSPTSFGRASAKANITTSASLPSSPSNATATKPGPTPRRVGPFRAGIVGFLAGSVLAGIITYYYILKEYRISNELLMGDIYSLQAAVHRTESYVRTLEDKVDNTSKTKRRLGD